MQLPIIEWYARVHPGIKLLLLVGSACLSATYDKWPPAAQDVVFWVGVICALIAFLGLLASAIRDWHAKKRNPMTFLVVGLAGAIVCLAIAGFGAWEIHRAYEGGEGNRSGTQGAETVTLESLAGVATQPSAPPKKYTAYERDSRIKAVDDLLGVLDGLRPLATEARELSRSFDKRVADGTLRSALADWLERAEKARPKWDQTISKYEERFPDLRGVTKHDVNVLSVTNPTVNLISEIERLSSKPNIEEYLLHNSLVAEWRQAVFRFLPWIVDTSKALAIQRQKYESYEVIDG